MQFGSLKVSQLDFDDIANGLPDNADARFTMVTEDLINPTKKIADIFSLTLPAQLKYTADETKLSDDEFQLLMDRDVQHLILSRQQLKVL